MSTIIGIYWIITELVGLLHGASPARHYPPEIQRFCADATDPDFLSVAWGNGRGNRRLGLLFSTGNPYFPRLLAEQPLKLSMGSEPSKGDRADGCIVS
jgi:hypothetical protein